MIFPSPRYSITGLAYLLDELICKIIITPLESPEIVPDFLAIHSLNLLIVEEVEGLLAKEHPHFAFDKRIETARHEPLVVLHTSGTTSHLKPILLTHDYAASFVQQNPWEPTPAKESVDMIYHGNGLLTILPVSHVSRLALDDISARLLLLDCRLTVIRRLETCLVYVAIANQTNTLFPLPSATLSAKPLISVLKHVDADVAVVPPIVAHQIATDPVKLEFVFKKIGTMGSAGGNISQATGDTLAHYGSIFPLYALTENGISPTLRSHVASTTDSWACIQFHLKAEYYWNLEWRCTGGAPIVGNFLFIALGL